MDSPVAREADILIVPSMEAGKLPAKQMVHPTSPEWVGVVVGIRVPVVLMSRSDSIGARLA